MSDGESTLRIKTTAEIAAVLQYTQAILASNSALAAHIALQQQANASGGGSGGGGGGGAPAGPTPAGAPPAPPPAATAGAGTGAPPPPPSATEAAEQREAEAKARRQEALADMAERRNAEAANKPGPPSTAGRIASSIVGGGASFLSNTVSTALGVGLGTSLMNLPMAALDTYMNLSKVLTQVRARFRDAEEGATTFGHAMGFTKGETAQLAETLGKVSNNLAGGQRYLGFALAMGADPGTTLTALGRLGNLTGRELSNEDLARLRGSAKAAGMDMGRMDEFLSRLEATTVQQFRQTGAMDPEMAAKLMAMPAKFFGAGTPGAQEDTGFMEGLNRMVSGGDNTWDTFIMRAIGFGSDPTMTYRKAYLQKERGLADPRNLKAILEDTELSKLKDDPDDLFRALIPPAQAAGLKGWQLDALVQGVSSGMSVEDLYKSIQQDPSETRDYAVPGDEVSGGARFNQAKEDRLYAAGAELAPSIDELERTIDNMVSVAKNFLGGDLGKSIERLASAVEKASKWADENTRDPGRNFQSGVSKLEDIQSREGWGTAGVVFGTAVLEVLINGFAKWSPYGMGLRSWGIEVPQVDLLNPVTEAVTADEAELQQQRDALRNGPAPALQRPVFGGNRR